MELTEQLPVSAEYHGQGQWASTGLAFSDYARMSVQVHKQSGKRGLETPEWAVDDRKLRELLVVFLENRARISPGTGPLTDRLARVQFEMRKEPQNLKPRLIKLSKQYVELKRQPDADPKRLRELEIEIEGIDTQCRLNKNGFADVAISVVYLFYRVGLDSVGVATELGMKPPHVRQILWRLRKTWKQMQDGTVGRKYKQRALIDVEWAARLRMAGKTLDEICTICGYNDMQQLSKALKAAGCKAPPRVYAPRPSIFNIELAISMYQAGKSVSEIALAMGYAPGSSKNKVRRELRKAGVWKPQADVIVKMIRQGKTNKELAPVIGCIHPNSVRRFLKHHDIYQPRKSGPACTIPIERAARLRAQGLTFKQIAQRLGMPTRQGGIHDALRRTGKIEPRPIAKQNPIDLNVCRELAAQGLSYADIARRLNCTPEGVSVETPACRVCNYESR